MKKYKISFTKYRDQGQTSFERSVTLEALQILFIMSDEVRVVQKKRTGNVTLIFNGDPNKFVSAKRLPYYILKQFLSEKEWT